MVYAYVVGQTFFKVNKSSVRAKKKLMSLDAFFNGEEEFKIDL